MWLLKLKDGVELTEHELGYWDNVPANAEIEAAALAVPRNGAPPYVFDFREFEEYCIARVSTAPAGSMGIPAGYSFYGTKRGMVTEVEILRDGMHVRSYPRERSELPERCWRRGVSRV